MSGSLAQSVDGVRRAYDTVADTYARLLPDTGAEDPLELAVLDSFAARVGPGARVLDAGCGTGRISRYLRDHGLAVEGIDLSPGMVAMARRDHPDLRFEVASLDALPYEDHGLDGVVLWYSTIHSGRAEQPALYREAARVLRAGGHLIVAFQTGEGTRDTSPAYRRHGHDVELMRHCYSVDEVSAWLADTGLTEACRMVRRPQGQERDDQAVILARR